jgi:hypothetical protein
MEAPEVLGLGIDIARQRLDERSAKRLPAPDLLGTEIVLRTPEPQDLAEQLLRPRQCRRRILPPDVDAGQFLGFHRPKIARKAARLD